MIKNDYHHGNLKDDFLNIAFDFIKHNNIDKLTLKILSDATGTSKSAIYKHLKNKDALIELMIEKGFKEFDDVITPILKDTDKSLIDRFAILPKSYIEWAKKNPNLYRLLFGQKYAYIREDIVSIKDVNCIGFGTLKLSIEEGQKSDILQKGDSYRQAIIIWSSLHGLATLMIDGFMDIKEVSDELYIDMFDSLLAGITRNNA